MKNEIKNTILKEIHKGPPKKTERDYTSAGIQSSIFSMEWKL